jgi:hypothetical protein
VSVDSLREKAFACLRWLRHPPRWFWIALVTILMELLYIFIITAGTYSKWPTWNGNYNLQAEGFRAGHLYLQVTPAPELLRKANPYDWANVRLWFWDASLWRGHYYLYWGPVPALAIAAVKTIFRMTSEVGDQYPLFVFYTIYLVAGAVLLDRIARRLFPQLPLPLVLLGIAVFACANPTPFEIATPGIYEAAIIGGQALLLAGVMFAFEAFWRADPGPTPRLPLILASTCWALAIGCRVSAGPVALLLGAATLVACHTPGPDSGRRLLRNLVYLGAPAAGGVALLLVYNKLRFERWLEFGLTYQLNTLPLTNKLAYLPLNIYSYLLRPLGVSCRFPFVSALRDIGARGFPAGTRFPPGYTTPEPLAGLLTSAPWAWLALLSPVLVAVGVRRWRRAGGAFPLGRVDRGHVWAIVCFAVMGSITALPIIAGFSATMRYLADISTGIVLLSIWGAWALYSDPAVHTRAWLRRLIVVLLVALGVTTIVLGLLLGVQGYDDMFKNHNPALYRSWSRALVLCRG